MKNIKLFIGIGIGILLALGITVYAINITVPSAPGSGYHLISTSTGAYFVSSTSTVRTNLGLGTAALQDASAFEVPLTFSTGLNRISNTIYNSGVLSFLTATGTIGVTTSTDTNLGIIVSRSGQDINFLPTWIGTLADNRIASTATWNAKQNAISFPISVASTSLAVTSPLSLSTNQLSMPTSTTAVSGFLTLTDWNTFNNKQATLVSGTNIKTINSNSLLGSGDLAISGGGVSSSTPFTAGYIPFATSSSAITNSNIFQSGLNIGIGTTTPSTLFTVATTTDIFRITSDGLVAIGSNPTLQPKFAVSENSAGFTMYVENKSGVGDVLKIDNISTNSANYIADFQSGGSTKLYVRADGKIGIGNSSPAYNLDITGNLRVTASSSLGDIYGAYLGTAIADAQIASQANWNSKATSTITITGTSGLSGGGDLTTNRTLTLNVANPNTWTATQDFTTSTFPGSGIWNNLGNVGIGTSTPIYKLDIVGTGRFTDILTQNGANLAGTAYKSQLFQNLLKNGDLESWSNGTSVAPNSWTWNVGGAGTIARESTTVKSGTYSAKLINEISQHNVLQRYLSSFGWNAWDYQGRTFTLGAWVKATTTLVYVSIGDSITGTVGSKTSHSGGGGWEFLTVTKTIASNSTEISVNLGIGAESASYTFYLDGIILVEGSVVPAFSRGALSDDGITLVVDSANNRVGVKTATPAYNLDITGNLRVTASSSLGDIYGAYLGTAIADAYISSAATWNAKQAGSINLTSIAAITTSTGSLIVGQGNTTGWAGLVVGTNGKVLTASSSATGGLSWESAGGTGTVTSVDMSVPTGLTIGGNPITSAGTLALTWTAGYEGLRTASSTDWNTAYADRLKWDGGATSLASSTGRTSLFGATPAANLVKLGELATSTGNLIIGSSTAGWVTMATGTTGKVLTSSSTAPNGLSWETAAGGTSLTTNTTSSATLRNSNDTEKAGISLYPTMTKLKEVKVNGTMGVVKINFEYLGVEGFTSYFQVYKNGTSTGALRNGTMSWATSTEILGGWVADDLIQIYAAAASVGAGNVTVKNMRFYYDKRITAFGDDTLVTPLETTGTVSITNQDP